MKLSCVKKSLMKFLFLCMFVFSFHISAQAAESAIDVKVKTIIENINEVPASVKTQTFSSNMMRVVNMYRLVRNSVYIPHAASPQKVFSWKHGGTTTVSFSATNESTSYDLLLFLNAANTDAHLSFSRVEFGKNARAYTYTDAGQANIPMKAFNWAEVIDSKNRNVEVTLYFRYNPEIGEMTKEPEPKVQYTKTIDYLGDGSSNPDTSANGKNDYRLYLSLGTEEKAKEKDKDIIFLLDVSGSMKNAFGSSTRFIKMKEALTNSDKGMIKALTQNPGNRISIIQFGSVTKTLITHSSNRRDLEQTVNNMVSNGGTNYYSAFNDAGKLIRTLVDPNRETVVFFLTDGVPTAATPAANAIGYTEQYPIAVLYAMDAASKLPKVSSFYSVFIGSNSGEAVSLQTVTQAVPVEKEKYMLHVTSDIQLQNAFDRFLSKLGDALYDVVIEDELTEYVDYLGEPKVVQITKGNQKTLISQKDYVLTLSPDRKKVKMELKGNTVSGSTYMLSFNVRSNANALAYYQDNNGVYPHTGDAGTDYSGNATSSGQSGFYSNTKASLKYKFSGGRTAEKIYAKPVVQLVAPPPVIPIPKESAIKAKKELSGLSLADVDPFDFVIYENKGGAERIVAEAKNDEDGAISFESLDIRRPGNYTLYMKELVPATPKNGMTYDTTVFELEAKVEWIGDELKLTAVNYKTPPVFVNTYKPSPVTIKLEAKKILTGRALKNQEFRFNLVHQGGLVSTAYNDASGNIQFPAFEIDKAGEYTYVMKEIPPIPVDSHIRYDIGLRQVHIKVKDVDGNLVADIDYADGNTFTNVFEYKPAVGQIKLKTILTGMRLQRDQFMFELRKTGDDDDDDDDDANEKQTVGNHVNGDILFAGIQYSVPGVHTYEVVQTTQKGDENMTYEKKVITVTVTVTDDGTGDLQADIQYSDPDPVFYNSYKVKGGIW